MLPETTRAGGLISRMIVKRHAGFARTGLADQAKTFLGAQREGHILDRVDRPARGVVVDAQVFQAQNIGLLCSLRRCPRCSLSCDWSLAGKLVWPLRPTS